MIFFLNFFFIWKFLLMFLTFKKYKSVILSLSKQFKWFSNNKIKKRKKNSARAPALHEKKHTEQELHKTKSYKSCMSNKFEVGLGAAQWRTSLLGSVSLAEFCHTQAFSRLTGSKWRSANSTCSSIVMQKMISVIILDEICLERNINFAKECTYFVLKVLNCLFELHTSLM